MNDPAEKQHEKLKDDYKIADISLNGVRKR